MQHSKELSDGEQDHLEITADPDSATTRQSFLLHLFQTLNLSDRDGVACIAKSTKIAIALRLRVLNDEIHPLLKLPAELIVAIGYQVMRINQTIPLPVEPGFPPPPRSDWRTAIGGFMNTSRRLRQELDLVPPGGVKIHYQPVRPSDFVKKCREIRRNLEYTCRTLQRRPLVIYMSLSRNTKGSTAAAYAAFVECTVFGSMQTPPVVYAQAKYDQRKRSGTILASVRDVYVSYARMLNMRRMSRRSNRGLTDRPVESDEAGRIWKGQKNARLYRRR
jgi:hypothetical protein